MEQLPRFDQRIAPFMQSIKSMSAPQTVSYDNISVRNVTYLPIAFQPRVGASA